MLSVERLRELIVYDPDTGLLRWKARPRVRAGKIAGSKHSGGYIELSIDGMHTFAHRIAFVLMVGRWPEDIDHINGERSDNRWCNLREARPQQNAGNMRRRPNNKSGYKGVVKHHNKWVSYIHLCGKTKYLGIYDSPELAHDAYLKEARAAFGEFARAA